MGYSRTPRPAIERFMEKVDFSADCYEWQANRNPKYGQFWDGARQVGAHRWAYETFVGPIPDGMCVLHRCDNPPCVNPDHLFLGTDADNVHDMIEKGRQATGAAVTNAGEDSGMAVLTEAQVRAIRKDRRTDQEIAGDYGVTWFNVNAVRRRVTWRHIPADDDDVLRNGLSLADVRAIRADTRLQREIGADYGLSQSTISGIKSGKSRAGAC